MGMIVTRRITEDFSPFKFFLMLLLSICDPDEVWFTSRRMSTSLSNANDGSGKTVKDLLKDKDVYLVTGKDVANKDKYINNLANDLKSSANVEVKIQPYWDVNEIYLRKKNRTVAAIMGSSECIRRDLDKTPRTGDLYSFDTKTDVICFDSEYDEQIRKACDEDPVVRAAICDYKSICIRDGGFNLDDMFKSMHIQPDED